jgi:hypothetical protein
MLVLLFSLAGVPPMLGFFAKFGVLKAAYGGCQHDLAWRILGAVASVIGAFYYLRIVYFMYFGYRARRARPCRMPAVQWVFLIASAAVMVLGVVNLFGIEGAAAGGRRRSCPLTGALAQGLCPPCLAEVDSTNSEAQRRAPRLTRADLDLARGRRRRAAGATGRGSCPRAISPRRW